MKLWTDVEDSAAAAAAALAAEEGGAAAVADILSRAELAAEFGAAELESSETLHTN